jgi:hypothetical protein
VTLQPQKTWAVITGDIVRSSSLSGNDLEQVRAQLSSAFMDVHCESPSTSAASSSAQELLTRVCRLE